MQRASVLASSDTGGLVGWAADVIESIGVLGVAALIALESIFPPIPSEVVLLLSGVVSGQGRFTLVGAVIASTIGSVVGALALYGVGAFVGEERLERWLATIGRPLGFRRADIDRADAWFERHGTWVVLFGRMVPLVRSLVSIPAGSERMPIGRFVALTAAGSAVWNSVWIGIGHSLGSRWEEAERWTSVLDALVIGGGLLAVAALAIRARRRRKLDAVP